MVLACRGMVGAAPPRPATWLRRAANLPAAQAVPPAVVPTNPGVRSDSCMNCGKDDFTAQCPTIRCEKCGKLGHIRQICQAVMPWEYVAIMCGFQAPGNGFFNLPDMSSARQVKDKASSVVITVIKGSTDARAIEKEFNNFFGSGWRCTARSISPSQYTMRFPNPKEVERACYYGERMHMKNSNAVIRLSPWSASIGAKFPLQKAWVRVRNIPSEKRCEAHAYYAASLIGVPLSLDASTLHRPEYVRILIGFRDVEAIPDKAEGCLGDNFYDFYYDVDKIVVGGPPKEQLSSQLEHRSDPPSPKRPRTETSSAPESSEGQTGGGSLSESWYGKTCQVGLETVSEHESEEESEDDRELLLDQLAKERELQGEKDSYLSSNDKQPLIDSDSDFVVEEIAPVNESSSVALPHPEVFSSVMSSAMTPFSYALCNETWPSLPRVEEMDSSECSPLIGSPNYVVHSPDESPVHGNGSPIMQVPEMENGVADTRFSTRNQGKNLEKVMDRAANITKKRKLEGLQKEGDKEILGENSRKLMKVAAVMAGSGS